MDERDMTARFQALERKLDRVLNELEFVKHRTATYLGKDIGMTYLVDETPIYVNTDDFGCPANFINGGRYEEEYIAVLSSFRRPTSVFLDIGANLGVFSLRLAPMLRGGKIFAFEPNPRIAALLARSSFLGGYNPIITLLPFGLSDSNREVSFSVPKDHAGGGSVSGVAAEDGRNFSIQVRRLDDWISGEVTVGLVKLDVEGHELQALMGMRVTLSRSPDVVVLFEKLAVRSGLEEQVAEFFRSLGMSLFYVDQTSLLPVDLHAFNERSGYFLAARDQTIAGQLDRSFFQVYAADLHLRNGSMNGDRYQLNSENSAGEVLFYGPYWYLARGTYRVELRGEITGELDLGIAERFGYPVASLKFNGEQRQQNVEIPRDLTKFELVGRGTGGRCTLDLEGFRLTRIG